jgi:hypothetical protein
MASRNSDTAAGGGGTTPGPPWVVEEGGLADRLEHEQFQEDGDGEKRADHPRRVYRGRGPERLEILAQGEGGGPAPGVPRNDDTAVGEGPNGFSQGRHRRSWGASGLSQRRNRGS